MAKAPAPKSQAVKTRSKPKVTRPPSKPRTKPTPKVGRPLGSKNIPRDEVDVIGSRCKRCGSSNRNPYQSDPTVLAHPGIDPITHQPYTHVIWRRTACSDCNQARIDKCYEQRLP